MRLGKDGGEFPLWMTPLMMSCVHSCEWLRGELSPGELMWR